MRNANAQCGSSMVRVSTLQQPPAPHVSHAEIGGRWCPELEARRIAVFESRMRSNRKENSISPALQCRTSPKGHRDGEENFRNPREREDHDGQRCALLTTKSRNTCTRATVFNSSG